MTEAERLQVAGLAHALVCRDKMSIRRAQRAMQVRFGVRRSVGSIWKDLRWSPCRICRQDPVCGRPC
jgi:hypothetical protein